MAPEQGYGGATSGWCRSAAEPSSARIGELAPGMQVRANGPQGPRIVTVVSVDRDFVTVDGNHPACGSDASFLARGRPRSARQRTRSSPTATCTDPAATTTRPAPRGAPRDPPARPAVSREGHGAPRGRARARRARRRRAARPGRRAAVQRWSRATASPPSGAARAGPRVRSSSSPAPPGATRASRATCIRAFSTWFEVVNLAERVHRVGAGAGSTSLTATGRSPAASATACTG